MDDILIQYLNRESIAEDSKCAFEKQIQKVKSYYDNGEIGAFGAFACLTFAFFLCLFLSVFYQFRYLIAKGLYSLTSKSRQPIHYWTEEEKERLEVLDNLQDYNAKVDKAIIIEKPKKLTQGECAVYLRKILSKNENILKGTVLRTTFPKVRGEELLEASITGTFNKPFIIQRVTFGNDINKALKILYPKLKNRKVRGQEDTYMVFEGDEVFELERELRELMMRPVTINLRARA